MKLQYQIFIAIFLFSLAGGVCWSAYYNHERFLTERLRADGLTEELKSERIITQTLRRQYAQIQEVLDDVAKKKIESDREAGRLRLELEEAQRTVPCASQRVPDIVTKRLCERVATVNAAADSK